MFDPIETLAPQDPVWDEPEGFEPVETDAAQSNEETPEPVTPVPDEDTLLALEWPALHQLLVQRCVTPYSRQRWEDSPFQPNSGAARQHMAQVEALRQMLQRYGEPILPSRSRQGGDVPDITDNLRRIAKGGMVTAGELGNIYFGLLACADLAYPFCRDWEADPEWATALRPLLEGFELPREAISVLEAIISTDGDLLDMASHAIRPLQHQIRQIRQGLQTRLQKMWSDPHIASALQEFIITEREGRFVLSVRAEAKGQVPGIVHDSSSSGATLFIEPAAITEMNNRLKSTQDDLDREIRRIIQQACTQLQPLCESLFVFLDRVGELDRRLAAARLSTFLNASPAHIPADDEPPVIDIRAAQHPLLMWQAIQRGDTRQAVIANDIRLGLDDVRTMIISGPNTGGKTVLLKLLGLCGLMVRAGLPLPAAEGSVMSWLDPILVDIGDQQSLQQNLSTFSAHLAHMNAFIRTDDLSRGLVLIDEIAAGTDPAEGVALARAVLQTLHDKGALTMVTTHLGELKVVAQQHEGYQNASVAFDAQTLQPTYKLNIGIPGTSHAITIAQKLGLPDEVIVAARGALSHPVRESVELIEELEIKTRQAEQALRDAERARNEAARIEESLKRQQEQLQQEKRKILQRFQSSFKQQIFTLEEQAKSLKQGLEAEHPKAVETASSRIKQMRRDLYNVVADTSEAIQPRRTDRPEVDQLTRWKNEETMLWNERLQFKGRIIEIHSSGEVVTLESGIIKVRVPANELKPTAEVGNLPKPSKKGFSTRRNVAEAGKPELSGPRVPLREFDVRGCRPHEAVIQVESFLDEATRDHLECVAIIHGQGTGALKGAIRDYLSGSAYVLKFYASEATQGGDGRTIIEL